MKNEVVVDFTDSQALKDLITGWKVGETYEPKIKMQLNSVEGNTAKFTAESWTIEGKEDEDDKEIATDANSPVSVVMGTAKESKGKESKAREPVSTY